MWFFYSYQLLLPALIVSVALGLFVKLRRNREHHGWWLAFLLFSVSLALALPVKPNPFQHHLTAYQTGEKTVEQIQNLVVDSWFQPVELRENVTKETIETLEKESATLTKSSEKGN